VILRSGDPLHQYTLACKYGLGQLRQESLIRCIGVPLDFANVPPLERKDLAALLELKASRTRDIQHVLQSAGSFTPQTPFFHYNSGWCQGGHQSTHRHRKKPPFLTPASRTRAP
jgi:hypothetical protein